MMNIQRHVARRQMEYSAAACMQADAEADAIVISILTALSAGAAV